MTTQQINELREQILANAVSFEYEGQEADNDMKAFALFDKAKRELRMADFLEKLPEILQSGKCVPVKMDTINNVFIFEIENVGTVDYWPKKPCLRIRKTPKGEKYIRGQQAFDYLLSIIWN
jgi:hypothetical protein